MLSPSVCPAPELHKRILRHVFRDGWTTRQDLERELGCTLMTVSKAVTALLEEGLLVVDGTLSAAAGRRKSVLKLNPYYRACICVDIGYDSVKLALVRMNGELEKKIVLPARDNPLTHGIPYKEMLFAIEALVQEAGMERVLGIGAGISGMVNFEEGRVLFCPNICGYDDRPLAEELSQRFSLPVLLDTSARCMALGEYAFGEGRGIGDQIFLSLGMGSIASGILANGRPYRGAQGFAGEIGHTCVRPGARNNRCSCGGHDCLELYATLQMLCANIQNALNQFSGYSAAKKLLANEPIAPANLRAAWLSGDPIVQEFVEGAVGDIASVLTGAVNLLTPSLVLLGGGFVWHLPEIVEMIGLRVRNTCLMPLRTSVRIERSSLGEDAALRGAATMLLSRYFSPA